MKTFIATVALLASTAVGATALTSTQQIMLGAFSGYVRGCTSMATSMNETVPTDAELDDLVKGCARLAINLYLRDVPATEQVKDFITEEAAEARMVGQRIRDGRLNRL